MSSLWLSPVQHPKRFNYGTMKIENGEISTYLDGKLRKFKDFADGLHHCFLQPPTFHWFLYSPNADKIITIMNAIADKYKFYISSSEQFLSVRVDEKRVIWFCNAHALFPFPLEDEGIETLSGLIKKFYRAYGIGGYGHTVAEQALMLWRHTVPKNELRVLCKTHEAFVRQAFYGGRTEVFTRWGKDLTMYDINSAFGYGMLQEMPSGSPYWTETFNEDQPGFFECEVKVNEKTEIPALPARKEGLPVYPTGRFETKLTVAEINYGRGIGYDIHTGTGISFTKKQTNLFSHFIDSFYFNKQAAECGSFEHNIAKLFMVTLFGKLGQSRDSKRMLRDDGGQGEMILVGEKETGYIQRDFTKKARYILPHIAAYITAHARILHHKLMLQSEQVFYCDTDSIISKSELHTGDKIGELRYEDHITEGIFLLPKTYAYHNCTRDVVKAKGFVKGKLTYEAFEKALHGDNSGLKCDWEKAPTIREYLKFGSGEKLTIKRVMNGLFYKRTLQPDGINTKPLVLGG